jgi:hypothetical protein
MSEELLDRRALAAVRFLDPITRRPVPDGLEVRVPTGSASFYPNASGMWVLRARGVLPTHAHAFEAPPGAPAEGSVTVSAEVHDTRGRYLPRAFQLAVPRVGEALFTPVDVELAPSPSLPLRQTWAAVRVSVRFGTDGDHPEVVPIEGAYVRLSAAELGGLRCGSLTDARGEALVVGHGIPRFLPGEDEETVIRATVAHELRVVVDEAATDLGTGRRSALADPDDLWERRDELNHTLSPGFDLQVGSQHTVVSVIART